MVSRPQIFGSVFASVVQFRNKKYHLKYEENKAKRKNVKTSSHKLRNGILKKN